MPTSSLPFTSTRFQTANRIHNSLTAAAEKRLLQWMAARAPHWLTSDQLTALGFSAQIAAGLAYALSRYNHLFFLVAILCIALNWFGDSMDGTLARIRNQQRPRYGFYVDHIVDVFGATALMCGLAFSGVLHWQTSLAMLIAFLLLSCESYLATYTLSQFQLSQGLFGPTEIRILLICGTLWLLHSPYSILGGHKILLFDFGGIIATAGMALMAVTTALSHTAQLYREEPLP